MTEQEKQAQIKLCRENITVWRNQLNKLLIIQIEPPKPTIEIVHHLALLKNIGSITINSDFSIKLREWRGNVKNIENSGAWVYTYDDCRKIAHILLKMIGEKE
jgi:hypothetical protein